MKLENVKVFVVGNPPPGYGGRYFVFLKLETACGIEGVGEVYAATFGPKIIAAMVEDLFARHFLGRDPFHIEALWRGVSRHGLYAAAGSVAHERGERAGNGLLGHHRQGGRASRSISCSGAACTSACAPIATSIRPTARARTSITTPRGRRARAAEYLKQGFTGVKFDPTGGFSAYDPRQPTQEQIERTVRLVRLIREAVGVGADLLVGTHGQFTTSGAIRLAKASRALRPAGGSKSRYRPRCLSRWPSSRAGPPFRSQPASGSPPSTSLHACSPQRRQYPADESRARRRPARGEESCRARRSALRADRPPSVLRPGGRRRQHSDRDVLPELLDPGEHPAVGRLSRENPEDADPLGVRLRDTRRPRPGSASNSTRPSPSPIRIRATGCTSRWRSNRSCTGGFWRSIVRAPG